MNKLWLITGRLHYHYDEICTCEFCNGHDRDDVVNLKNCTILAFDEDEAMANAARRIVSEREGEPVTEYEYSADTTVELAPEEIMLRLNNVPELPLLFEER